MGIYYGLISRELWSSIANYCLVICDQWHSLLSFIYIYRYRSKTLAVVDLSGWIWGLYKHTHTHKYLKQVSWCLSLSLFIFSLIYYDWWLGDLFVIFYQTCVFLFWLWLGSLYTCWVILDLSNSISIYFDHVLFHFIARRITWGCCTSFYTFMHCVCLSILRC